SHGGVAPTRPTIYYCDAGYILNTGEDNTCSRTITTTPTEITVDGCPSVPTGEPLYKLTTATTATTTITTCTRTITIPATTPRSCPAGYKPILTVGEYRIARTSCGLD
ncbi:MAG: hypothetical protein OXG69_06940, partial [bacterium]|nr:hypothetical protein [bacterium]